MEAYGQPAFVVLGPNLPAARPTAVPNDGPAHGPPPPPVTTVGNGGPQLNSPGS